MFTFISIMAVGVLIGYPLRHKSQIRKITPLIHIVVCLLLFLLGLSIGLNRLIIDNLGYFCSQAAVISSLSILGSMMASLAVYRIFFRGKGTNGEKQSCNSSLFLVWLRSRSQLCGGLRRTPNLCICTICTDAVTRH